MTRIRKLGHEVQVTPTVELKGFPPCQTYRLQTRSSMRSKCQLICNRGRSNGEGIDRASALSMELFANTGGTGELSCWK